MKALLLDRPYSLSLADIPIPVPNENQVLIRVKRAGICGSDLHAFAGKHSRRIPPVVLGHEMSGEIEERGPGIEKSIVGKRATVIPEEGCGVCKYCLQGWTNLCSCKKLLGSNEWSGAFSEFIIAPVGLVLPICNSINLSLGALAEPLAVTIHALKQAEFRPDSNIVIFGAGSIGQLIIRVARLKGAKNIVVFDLKDFNLEIARRGGATAFNNGVLSPIKLLNDYNWEFDFTFIAASYHDLINQSFLLTEKRGRIVLVGQFNKPGVIDVDKARLKEQIIRSSFTAVKSDYVEAIRLLESYPNVFSDLITHRVKLEDGIGIFKAFHENTINAVKVMICCDQSESNIN